MVVKRWRNKFKKLKGVKANCWFCREPTLYVMYEQDGSEIWCCEKCLWNEGKIKRFKPKTIKGIEKTKKVKKNQIIKGKVD